MIAEETLEAQGRLQPGQEGYWKVWGAQPRHIRPGDILGSMVDGKATFDLVEDTFTAQPICRVGIVVNGKRETIGALCPIVLMRYGRNNTLAD